MIPNNKRELLRQIRLREEFGEPTTDLMERLEAMDQPSLQTRPVPAGDSAQAALSAKMAALLEQISSMEAGEARQRVVLATPRVAVRKSQYVLSTSPAYSEQDAESALEGLRSILSNIQGQSGPEAELWMATCSILAGLVHAGMAQHEMEVSESEAWIVGEYKVDEP
ncbi:MAG: hypothetical protein VX899_08460 [Myxococcota bacterium]|nr:hypothetical protein [Myxococcota bacterium]